jgi:hypothetical protein
MSYIMIQQFEFEELKHFWADFVTSLYVKSNSESLSVKNIFLYLFYYPYFNMILILYFFLVNYNYIILIQVNPTYSISCLCSLVFYSLLLDRVFGPTTTTRHVYDVAAQHVVSGTMEGINGK